MAEEKQLLLGIDFGTSRTAVMSNFGAKATVATVVGYPKDLIGVKLLGGDKVVGDEALARRSYLSLHYPLQDGVLKEAGEREVEVALELLKYVVDLARTGEETQVCGVIGVPARASNANKDHLLAMSKDIFDTTLVVSEPFMVAYGLEQLLNSIIIDIGAGTTDICALKGKMPGVEDEVSLLKGGDYIDEVLKNAIEQRYPGAKLTSHFVRQTKEQYAFVCDPQSQVVVTLRQAGKPIACDITQEVRVACEAVVSDIVEQVEILLQAYDPEDLDAVLSNIWLAGGGSGIRGIGPMIAERLAEYGEATVNIVPDPEYAGSIGALKLATDLPPEYWDQLGEMIGTG